MIIFECVSFGQICSLAAFSKGLYLVVLLQTSLETCF
jgi:hypothetical protein